MFRRRCKPVILGVCVVLLCQGGCRTCHVAVASSLYFEPARMNHGYGLDISCRAPLQPVGAARNPLAACRIWREKRVFPIYGASTACLYGRHELTRPALAGIALVAMVSAASGWFLSNAWRSSRALPETGPANAPAAPPAPDRVRVFSDGTVSIQLSKAPLRWLFDEIARQGGALPVEASGPAVRSPMVPVAAPSEGGRDDPAKSEARDSTEFVQALRGGNEAERLEALEEARSIGADLPADLLQHLIDSDPSDEVRAQAVRTYVDVRSHEADAVSALLDASRYNHSAAVRAESGKTLELIDQRQHVQTANLQP